MLFIKFFLAELKYCVASFRLGVQAFISMTVIAAEDRKFARDLQVSLRSQSGQTPSPSTINRARKRCASIRDWELDFEDDHAMTLFIIAPMRRNFRENREMLEEALQAWEEKSAMDGANLRR